MKISKKKILQIFFLGVVFFFLFKIYMRSLPQIVSQSFSFRLPFFLLSLLFFLTATIMQGWIWSYIVTFFQIQKGGFKDFYIWVISLIGKYIPGKIFLYLGRYYFYIKDRDKSKIKVPYLYAFLTEILSSILASLFIFLLAFLFADINDIAIVAKYKIIAVIFIFVLLMMIFLLNLPFFKNIFVFIFKDKAILSIKFNPFFLLQTILLYMAAWFFFSYGFYFLIQAFSTFKISIFYVAGVFSLASVAGMLAIFAPSGIGVRESVIVLLLALVLPESFAAFISLVARIWASSLEILLIGIVFLVGKLMQKRKLKSLF